MLTSQGRLSRCRDVYPVPRLDRRATTQPPEPRGDRRIGLQQSTQYVQQQVFATLAMVADTVSEVKVKPSNDPSTLVCRRSWILTPNQ